MRNKEHGYKEWPVPYFFFIPHPYTPTPHPFGTMFDKGARMYN